MEADSPPVAIPHQAGAYCDPQPLVNRRFNLLPLFRSFAFFFRSVCPPWDALVLHRTAPQATPPGTSLFIVGLAQLETAVNHAQAWPHGLERLRKFKLQFLALHFKRRCPRVRQGPLWILWQWWTKTNSRVCC